MSHQDPKTRHELAELVRDFETISQNVASYFMFSTLREDRLRALLAETNLN